jgi:hypothetical protein
VIAPAEEAVKEVETPAAEVVTPKDKRRTSFFGAFGKKEKKAETSDGEVTDGEGKETKAKANKLGTLFRKNSKAVKLDKEEVTAAETEAKADKAEETPATEEATTQETPAVDEASKPAEAATEETKNVTVPAVTPVQAAA